MAAPKFYVLLFFRFPVRTHVHASCLITLGVVAKDIIVAGKNRVKNNSRNSGDCKSCERDGRPAHRKGKAAVEPKSAYQNHSRDNQVSGFCKVQY